MIFILPRGIKFDIRRAKNHSEVFYEFQKKCREPLELFNNTIFLAFSKKCYRKQNVKMSCSLIALEKNVEDELPLSFYFLEVV